MNVDRELKRKSLPLITVELILRRAAQRKGLPPEPFDTMALWALIEGAPLVMDLANKYMERPDLHPSTKAAIRRRFESTEYDLVDKRWAMAYIHNLKIESYRKAIERQKAA